ncbi:hypothetical protein HD806DRAFT_509366 [Xylariaceae sp. AK1471]|nr:hypothetical protein HD806DRAFT_509366 [Xylariaceae sp. AK1471]
METVSGGEATTLDHLKGTWLETTDSKLRRKLQNRINQRLSRYRRASKTSTGATRTRSLADRTKSKPRVLLPKESDRNSGDDISSHKTETCPRTPTPLISHTSTPSQPHGHEVPGQVAARPTPSTPWRSSVPMSLDLLEAIQPALSDMHTKGIFHYTLQALLPTLGAKTLSGEVLPAALFRKAIEDPLVFQAIIVGGAGRRITYTNSREDHHCFLRAQMATARAIREALRARKMTDGLLFAIMALSLRPNAYVASLFPHERYQGSFDSPMKEIGGLTWLGLIELAPEHADILLHLLIAHQNDAMSISPGLAEYLQLADLLQASLTLSQPQMELTGSYESILAHETRSIRLPKSDAAVFQVDEHFKDIILDMKLCCRLIDTFNGTLDFDSNTSRFVQYRDLIQYRLLKLPYSPDEICRLAVMIFSYGVLYPVPDPRPMQRLIRELCSIMMRPEVTAEEDKEFLLWAAFMGGIGAAKAELRNVFVGMVAQHAIRLGIEDWDVVVLVLRKFLWLECACNMGGKDLWQQYVDKHDSYTLPESLEGLIINNEP